MGLGLNEGLDRTRATVDLLWNFIDTLASIAVLARGDEIVQFVRSAIGDCNPMIDFEWDVRWSTSTVCASEGVSSEDKPA